MTDQNTPPNNVRWIMGNHDLPQNYGAVGFRVTDTDDATHVTVMSKRNRQVFEALMIGPVYCASPVRLSDVVLILRHDHLINIETTFYEDTSGPVSTRYGVYSLIDRVEPIMGIEKDIDEEFMKSMKRIRKANARFNKWSLAQGASYTGRPGAQKPNYGLLAVGGAIMMLGVQAVKYATENYEAIRDSSGIGTTAGLGLAGMAALLIGIFVMKRAVFKRRAAPDRAAASQYSATVAQPVQRASIRARVLFSFLGFTIGTIACLYMFMAAAARFVETETAQFIGIGGVLIAFLLALVSLLFGLVGLFLRGYALWRVPVYFLFGGVLTFATVRVSGINILEWQQFLVLLQ